MKKFENLRIGFNIYFTLLELAVLNPNNYSSFLKNINLSQSLVFFVINVSLWLILSTAIRTFLFERYRLVFAFFSEALILAIIILLFLVFLSLMLHLLAKIFGTRTKLKNNFKAVLFSTILLPFFSIPLFKVLAVIMSFYLLVYNYKAINRFDRVKAVVPVAIISGITIFALFSMQIINSNLITR